jgi:hypothetical protein
MKNPFINAKSLVLASFLATLTFPMPVPAEAGAKSLFISIDDNDLASANKSKPVTRVTKKNQPEQKTSTQYECVSHSFRLYRFAVLD